jgi:hypothetical protein
MFDTAQYLEKALNERIIPAATELSEELSLARQQLSNERKMLIVQLIK